MTLPEPDNGSVPDKGDRVRVTGPTIGRRSEWIGCVGWVRRFYIGHFFSVGVALDGDDGIRAFRPEELTVIR